MTGRLQALGYVEGKVVWENPVAATGKTIREHEFRCSWMNCARDARFAYRFTRGKGILNDKDGPTELNAPGSYLHTHVYSYPMGRFVGGAGSAGEVRRKGIERLWGILGG